MLKMVYYQIIIKIRDAIPLYHQRFEKSSRIFNHKKNLIHF